MERSGQRWRPRLDHGVPRVPASGMARLRWDERVVAAGGRSRRAGERAAGDRRRGAARIPEPAAVLGRERCRVPRHRACDGGDGRERRARG